MVHTRRVRRASRKPDLTQLQAAGHGTLRLVNRRILLSIVAGKQPVSRAEIAKISGLNKATISTIVGGLVRQGYLLEQAAGKTTPLGGKPPIPLRLNPLRFGVFAVDIGAEETIVALGDFNGQVAAQRTLSTGSDPCPFLQEVGNEIAALRDEHPQFEEIAGAGVSLPGLVDPGTGTFLVSVVLPWKEVPVVEWLHQATGLPVLADTSARCAALAEIWYSKEHYAHVRNLLYVGVSAGLSCGLVVDGALYGGGNSTAGQFGHMPIQLDGPACACGLRGCWDLYASDKATLERYRQLRGLAGARGPSMTRLMERVEAGEPEATQAVRETARYLGVGLAGLVNGLEPEMVVIGGAITRAWGLIEPIISEETRRNLLDRRARSLVIRRSSFEVRPSLKGALTLILNELFSVPHVG